MADLILTAATLFQPIDLDGISIERARAMSGRPVIASFVVAKPLYKLRGLTVIGAADRDDRAERTVVLKDQRLDIREGERTTVAGMLRVINHRANVVNGALVPAWIEVRVEA